MKLCPRCGRELVLRKSKHGEFLGCSGWPVCTHTQHTESADEAKRKAIKKIEKMADQFLKECGYKKNGERV